MLPQNLIQNPVITVEENNDFVINWDQAAQLTNLNFYHTLRAVDECENYRKNQYPYIDIGVGEVKSTQAATEAWMRTLQLHSIFTISGEDMVTMYRTIFGAASTLTEGAVVVRINDTNTDITKDFFAITPSVVKFFFSPNGWYTERDINNNVTHVRKPFWGLKTKQTLSIGVFSPWRKDAQSQWYMAAQIWERDLTNYKFRIIDTSATPYKTNDDTFFFATDLTANFPIPEDRQVNQDQMWARIIDGDLVMNVPTIITRSRETRPDGVMEYCYRILLPYNIPTGNTVVVEFY